MRGWWKRPEYIRERKAFVKRNPVCIRCGRPTQTPGHTHDDYQHGYEHYLQRVIDDDCEPLCNRCNHNERYGRKPCPECVTLAREHEYDIGIRIRYISQFEEVCFSHLPEAEQSRIWSRKRRHLDKHPCIWHGKGQRCKSVIRWSNTCDRSALTAEGCDQFMGKKVKA